MNGARHWKDAEPADYAVIGDPVEHSRSPQMHAAAYRVLGLPHRYVALRVPRGEVSACFARLSELGYRGVNVTVPHKNEAFLAMRTVEPFARRIEAVNTVRLPELHGTNTDGPGFIDTIEPVGLPSGSKVLLLGSGGSAYSIATALAEAGYALRIWNRTRSRADQMVAKLGLDAEIADDADPSGCALLVNTTSAGLQGADLPVRWAQCRPDAVAYDLMYGDQPTPFLKSADDRGLRTIDGRPLLASQGARSLEWWLGVQAPRDVMLDSLK